MLIIRARTGNSSPSRRAVAGCALVFAAFVAVPARADDALPEAVAAALQRARLPLASVGLVVQRLADGSSPGRRDGTLLSVNARQPMNPASTMKLVTTYAALELLGPAFTWKTDLATDAPQNGATLDGDLYLRGAGDPKLVFEQVWLMLRQLRDRGIRTIAGDLVLDRTLFEPGPYDPGAFDGEPFRPYNVGPDALLINFKAVTLRFVPDDAAREVRVTAQPSLPDVAIGPVAYADGPCGDWRQRAMADFGRPDAIDFAGSYAGRVRRADVERRAARPPALRRGRCSEACGPSSAARSRGGVRDGAVPAGARVLVEHESPSLADVVRDINKFSNNVMARELFLSTAAEVTRSPANGAAAQRVVRDFYASRGLDLPELVLDNGSGLSRSERISAASMASVLQAAWQSPVMPEFIASLPLVGFDGTMKRRLVERTVAGRAHVKTGTLADARAMAGYLFAASGARYLVVFLVNHPNAASAQPAQDALLQWLYDRG